MRYSATTTAPPPDVIHAAREAFGASGAGLRLAQQEMLGARFEGPAGFVHIEARRYPDGLTEVVVETREFDREVRQFLSILPRRSLIEVARAKLRAMRAPKDSPR
jgi:hypothetical protein